MDGFSVNGRHSSIAAGILYAEDFDDPADDGELAQHDAPPPPPTFTQADLDAACAEAVGTARREWQASHEQGTLNALIALTAALGGLREDAERSTVAVAEETVVAILSIVCGLLPHFSAEHGPAEVRALLARLLPTFQAQGRIEVRVHPDLVAPLERDLARMQLNARASVEIVAAALEPGDVKVTWESGSMIRDSRVLAQAVEDALGELGLKKATEAPAKRRMAYAD